MNNLEIAGLFLAILMTIMGLYNIAHGVTPDDKMGAYTDLILAGIMGYLVIFWKVSPDEKKDKKKTKVSFLKDFFYYTIPAVTIAASLFYLAKYFGG
jgi:ethanolamine transporter EutH